LPLSRWDGLPRSRTLQYGEISDTVALVQALKMPMKLSLFPYF
jgi:hypothetical protein